MKLFRALFSIVLAIALVSITYMYFQSDVVPVRWSPPAIPPMTGEFQVTSTSSFSNERLWSMPGEGPEDVALGPDGFYYTGLADGSIVRFSADTTSTVETVANTGGRPLGLQFDAQGSLIIADAYKGLLKLDRNGELDILVDEVAGVRMKLVDDLDIAKDGTIWFSDASQRFDLHHFMKDILEASATGRLLSYSPQTRSTTVKMTGLFFANGVALGPGDQFVLVNETGTGRIHRLWLDGAKTGQRDVFHEGLPGHPDNVSFNGTDTFWVALPAMRDAARDGASDSLFFRKLLGALPVDALAVETRTGFVLGLNIDGAVTHLLHGDPAEFTAITSVNQFEDRLLLGSLTQKRVMSEPLPPKRR